VRIAFSACEEISLKTSFSIMRALNSIIKQFWRCLPTNYFLLLIYFFRNSSFFG
jgi:hypothetical protein